VSGFNGKEADDKLKLGDTAIRVVRSDTTRLGEKAKTKPPEESMQNDNE
jgi:hypothetical protein